MVRFILGAAFALLCMIAGVPVHASPASEDEHAIAKTIDLYLRGTSFNQQDDIRQAFHSQSRLYLDGDHGQIREMSGPEYAGLFPAERQGQFNGRVGRLLNVHVSGGVATAKAEILMPNRGPRYLDVFLLRKIAGEWKIVSKTAHRDDAPVQARKVLLVVSNADRYPGSTINAGNNFPELAYSWDVFHRAGYAVDVVSPQGGAAPLEMINTTDPLLKRYLYDPDFMWALAHTRPAAAIAPGDYAGIVFAGGGAAILGVPDDARLQDIARRIYEEQGGVLAAICQGTEGLANLRLKDGSYLMRGKTMTSFPDAFLNPAAPIFKAYPFSMQKTIARRGGKFTHGENGKGHVEVDGRLVTGMNWESSVGVAQAMIRLMEGRP